MRTIGILYFRVELPRSSVLEDYRRLSGPFFDINYCRQTSVRYRFFISPTSSRRFRGQVVVKKEKEKKKRKSIYVLVKVQPVQQQQQQLVIISADKTRVGIERRTKTMDTRRDADGTSSSGTTCVDKFIRIAVGFTIKRATAFVGHSRRTIHYPRGKFIRRTPTQPIHHPPRFFFSFFFFSRLLSCRALFLLPLVFFPLPLFYLPNTASFHRYCHPCIVD